MLTDGHAAQQVPGAQFRLMVVALSPASGRRLPPRSRRGSALAVVPPEPRAQQPDLHGFLDMTLSCRVVPSRPLTLHTLDPPRAPEFTPLTGAAPRNPRRRVVPSRPHESPPVSRLKHPDCSPHGLSQPPSPSRLPCLIRVSPNPVGSIPSSAPYPWGHVPTPQRGATATLARLPDSGSHTTDTRGGRPGLT